MTVTESPRSLRAPAIAHALLLAFSCVRADALQTDTSAASPSPITFVVSIQDDGSLQYVSGLNGSIPALLSKAPILTRPRHELNGTTSAKHKWTTTARKLLSGLVSPFSLNPKQGEIQERTEIKILLFLIFIAGLTLIALEEVYHINKSAVALILGALLWAIVASTTFVGTRFEKRLKDTEYEEGLSSGMDDVGGIVLFLFPAMAMVETMDHLGGFLFVRRLVIRACGGKRWALMPFMSALTFVMSAIVDNLTSTIIALKTLQSVVPDDAHWRRLTGGLVVIAANAGGVWSPIGDVTTTMLWSADRISAAPTILHLFLPSLVAAMAPLGGLMFMQHWHHRNNPEAMADDSGEPNSQKEGGSPTAQEAQTGAEDPQQEGFVQRQLSDWAIEVSETAPKLEPWRQQSLVLVLGIICILFAPLMKGVVNLPPYMGMLLGVGIFWVITDWLGIKGVAYGGEDPEVFSNFGRPKKMDDSVWKGGVVAALNKVELTGLFFFTGILFSVAALEAGGVIDALGDMLNNIFGDPPKPLPLCYILGIVSAIFDNVPLVQASIDMYKDVPQDDAFWQVLTLSTGIGGSLLSIGSSAGVIYMAIEGVEFIWYLKYISGWALAGFFMAIWTYQLQELII